MTPVPNHDLLLLSDLPEKITSETVFGNSLPLEIEIGAGRGDFIVSYAAAHPEINMIGIERKHVYLRRGLSKLRLAQLNNLILISTDARHLLSNYITEGSLRGIHLYFPDPWPKRRHIKRRLFSRPLLDQFKRTLVEHGMLHLRTDVESYYTTMMSEMSALPEFRRIETPADIAEHKTGFEMRFLKAQKPIYQATYQLTAKTIAVDAGGL